MQFSASQKNMSIKGTESGKSRIIYAKIKAEIDALGSPKTTRQIQETLRNLKDSYKKAIKNNEKQGQHLSFYHFITTLTKIYLTEMLLIFLRVYKTIHP